MNDPTSKSPVTVGTIQRPTAGEGCTIPLTGCERVARSGAGLRASRVVRAVCGFLFFRVSFPLVRHAGQLIRWPFGNLTREMQ